MNLSELKNFKTIITNNKYNETIEIKLHSVYYKMNHDTKRCFLAYDGSWKYNDDEKSNVYGQSMLDLKRFIKKEGTVKYKFQ